MNKQTKLRLSFIWWVVMAIGLILAMPNKFQDFPNYEPYTWVLIVLVFVAISNAHDAWDKL